VGVIALGSASIRPDSLQVEVLDVLRKSACIFVSLDSDKAGGKAAWQLWLKTFPQALRLPPIKGKDIAEMRLAGVNLRNWLEVGIDYYSQNVAAQVRAEIKPRPLGYENEIASVSTISPDSFPLKEHRTEASDHLARKPQPLERRSTCFECSHFRPAVTSPNPTQARGHCEKRQKGRYGVATACEALTPKQ